MTPAFWFLRALNLLAALAAAKLASHGRAVDFAPPVLVFASVSAVEGALAFTGRPSDPALRRWTTLGASIAEATVLVWLSFWASAAAGVFDLAYLVPAVVAALEYGPVAGALCGAVPAGLTAAVLLQGLPADQRGFLPVAAARALFFVLAPAAAGMAAPGARSDGAARARRTLGRLRAAQVGEYISFVLFQLRDYLITIASTSEALALSAPPGDPRLGERLDRLRRAAAEMNAKMARLLGDKSALTSVAPPTRSAMDLAALAREVADEARAAFAPPAVSLEVMVVGPAPVARTDRRPVELALLAVLQNAVEACAERGGGAVTVVVRRGGVGAEIEVTDDGGGITEGVRPLVFEPLASSRPGRDGMGLGLSMSRRFLERLGGSLRLKSKGGCTAALLTVPLEHELPRIRTEESTWAGRRAGGPGDAR